MDDEVKRVIEITLTDDTLNDKEKIGSLVFYLTQKDLQIKHLRGQMQAWHDDISKERHKIAEVFMFIRENCCEQCKKMYDSSQKDTNAPLSEKTVTKQDDGSLKILDKDLIDFQEGGSNWFPDDEFIATERVKNDN